MQKIAVRRAAPADGRACADILSHYILHTAVNMHTEPVAADYFSNLARGDGRFFVACDSDSDSGSDGDSNSADSVLEKKEGGEVCGYAYAEPWNSRCGYCGTVEVSVYVKNGMQERGIGGRLLQTLADALGQDGMRAAVALITLPNPASIRLHEKCGFVRAGVLPAVGWKFKAARDIGIWVRNFA